VQPRNFLSRVITGNERTTVLSSSVDSFSSLHIRIEFSSYGSQVMSTQTDQPMFGVLLLNDDHTPMEFVVHILERFFEKDRENATQIMLRIHNDGIAECGIYEYDLAKAKVSQVLNFAREHQHPLQCVLERRSA